MRRFLKLLDPDAVEFSFQSYHDVEKGKKEDRSLARVWRGREPSRGLIDLYNRGAAKTRLQTTRQTLLKHQINARLRQIETQIQQIDATVAEKVAQDDALSHKLAILISIPGIAEITAFSMIVEMPELGTLDGKQAASLAGLAPISQQSGKCARPARHGAGHRGARLKRAANRELRKSSHVRTAADKRAAEEIANRTRAEDFEGFKPLFAQVQKDLESGVRQTRPFELKAEIRPGSWSIVGGQKAYVAEMGEMFSNAQGRTDARLRVIFDNGTESNLLMRSLQRALHKDEAGRRITDPVAGPLFAGDVEADDLPSGTIYVLRSKSDDPAIAQHRDVLHKIGVTGGKVETRIANAKLDPTFLLADVEIIATYKLSNISRTKLENLIHRIFDPARLDIQIRDRFGNSVIPARMVPCPAVRDRPRKWRRLRTAPTTDTIRRAAALVRSNV
jgi:hypothetical protein